MADELFTFDLEADGSRAATAATFLSTLAYPSDRQARNLLYGALLASVSQYPVDYPLSPDLLDKGYWKIFSERFTPTGWLVGMTLEVALKRFSQKQANKFLKNTALYIQGLPVKEGPEYLGRKTFVDKIDQSAFWATLPVLHLASALDLALYGKRIVNLSELMADLSWLKVCLEVGENFRALFDSQGLVPQGGIIRFLPKGEAPDKEETGWGIRNSFPTPPGTTWRDVTLTLRENLVEITVKKEEKSFLTGPLGLIDSRTKKPNNLFCILVAFSYNGVINKETPGIPNPDTLKSRIYTLRKILKRIMRIKTDPFPYSRNEGYLNTLKIRIHPDLKNYNQSQQEANPTGENQDSRDKDIQAIIDEKTNTVKSQNPLP